MHLLGRILLVAALLAGSLVGAREPGTPQASEPVPASRPASPSAAPVAPPADFVPSERIPADAEVPFPVDI